jgi:hypothetical protein
MCQLWKPVFHSLPANGWNVFNLPPQLYDGKVLNDVLSFQMVSASNLTLLRANKVPASYGLSGPDLCL